MDLIVLSVREHFAIVRGRTVVLDIGGGSLEIVLAVGGLVEHAISLPFGAVRTTEQFLGPGVAAAGGVRKLLREEVELVKGVAGVVITANGALASIDTIVKSSTASWSDRRQSKYCGVLSTGTRTRPRRRNAFAVRLSKGG